MNVPNLDASLNLLRIRNTTGTEKSPVIDIDPGRLLSERPDSEAAKLQVAAYELLRPQPHKQEEDEQDKTDGKESNYNELIARFRSNGRFTSVALRCVLEHHSFNIVVIN